MHPRVMNNFERTNLSKLKYCPEDWGKMKPTIGGRICGECSKKIVDFRKNSHSEIAQAHLNSSSPICGIYESWQLDHGDPKPSNKTYPLTKIAASVLSLMSLTTAVEAQEQNRTELTEQQPEPPECVIVKEVKQQQSTRAVIRGRVYEQFESGIQEPVPFANIYVEGTKMGVTSDMDGNYELTIEDSLELDYPLMITAQYIGMTPVSFEIEQGQNEINRDIIFESDANIIAFYVSYEEPSLPRRTWNRIKNLFRAKERY